MHEENSTSQCNENQFLAILNNLTSPSNTQQQLSSLHQQLSSLTLNTKCLRFCKQNIENSKNPLPLRQAAASVLSFITDHHISVIRSQRHTNCSQQQQSQIHQHRNCLTSILENILQNDAMPIKLYGVLVRCVVRLKYCNAQWNLGTLLKKVELYVKQGRFIVAVQFMRQVKAHCKLRQQENDEMISLSLQLMPEIAIENLKDRIPDQSCDVLEMCLCEINIALEQLSPTHQFIHTANQTFTELLMITTHKALNDNTLEPQIIGECLQLVYHTIGQYRHKQHRTQALQEILRQFAEKILSKLLIQSNVQALVPQKIDEFDRLEWQLKIICQSISTGICNLKKMETGSLEATVSELLYKLITAVYQSFIRFVSFGIIPSEGSSDIPIPSSHITQGTLSDYIQSIFMGPPINDLFCVQRSLVTITRQIFKRLPILYNASTNDIINTLLSIDSDPTTLCILCLVSYNNHSHILTPTQCQQFVLQLATSFSLPHNMAIYALHLCVLWLYMEDAELQKHIEVYQGIAMSIVNALRGIKEMGIVSLAVSCLKMYLDAIRELSAGCHSQQQYITYTIKIISTLFGNISHNQRAVYLLLPYNHFSSTLQSINNTRSLFQTLLYKSPQLPLHQLLKILKQILQIQQFSCFQTDVLNWLASCQTMMIEGDGSKMLKHEYYDGVCEIMDLCGRSCRSDCDYFWSTQQSIVLLEYLLSSIRQNLHSYPKDSGHPANDSDCPTNDTIIHSSANDSTQHCLNNLLLFNPTTHQLLNTCSIHLTSLNTPTINSIMSILLKFFYLNFGKHIHTQQHIFMLQKLLIITHSFVYYQHMCLDDSNIHAIVDVYLLHYETTPTATPTIRAITSKFNILALLLLTYEYQRTVHTFANRNIHFASVFDRLFLQDENYAVSYDCSIFIVTTVHLAKKIICHINIQVEDPIVELVTRLLFYRYLHFMVAAMVLCLDRIYASSEYTQQHPCIPEINSDTLLHAPKFNENNILMQFNEFEVFQNFYQWLQKYCVDEHLRIWLHKLGDCYLKELFCGATFHELLSVNKRWSRNGDIMYRKAVRIRRNFG